MSPSEIETIRNLRACNIAWPVVAKNLKATIQECREAIGLPTYATTDRQSLPWDAVQQTLFNTESEGQI